MVNYIAALLGLKEKGKLAKEVMGLRGVKFALSVVVFVILTGGGLFSLFESKAGHIVTYWDGVWWAIVTITTVGYGDYYPVTVAGRIVGIFVMFSGIGFVATVTTALATHAISKKTADHLEDSLRQIDKKFEAHTNDVDQLLSKHFKHHRDILAQNQADPHQVTLEDIRREGSEVVAQVTVRPEVSEGQA